MGHSVDLFFCVCAFVTFINKYCVTVLLCYLLLSLQAIKWWFHFVHLTYVDIR